MAWNHLFAPGRIGHLVLPNRLIKSATLENLATPDGLPTAAMGRFYERLARGGAGMLITGFAYVNRTGQSYPLQSGAHTDAMIAAWRPITAAVHAHGAKIAMQIAHGGRQTKPKALGGRRPVAPSAMPNLLYFSWARSMTDAEIRQTIADFAAAAARVKAAGFDAVQLHAGHGYLISSFLSPLTNRRRDQWGGDFQRRFRFLEEVYLAVRQAVGPDFPVMAKLNINDFVALGLIPRDSFPAARALAEMGLDALEISGGIYETALHIMRGEAPVEIFGRGRHRLERWLLAAALGLQKRRTRFEEAYFRKYAEKLKLQLTIPLILVGGIRRPAVAEEIIASGIADFVSLARPLIREPGLPRKWRAGEAAPALCRSCNRCLGEMEQGNPLRCYARA